MPTGRFAPSPTGDLHLGNLRTALLAWLWSRHHGDGFVVRMEDLDRVTSSPVHEASQLRDLAAVGLDWDGDVVRQSDRFDRYRDALAQLESAGLAYPCYCTRREIAEAAAAPHGPAPGRYPGTCRDLTAAGRRELEAAGRPAALRLRADPATIHFDDGVVGPRTGRPDDVVLYRNDGVPAYNLAVVVDDAAQGIGVVVRGDDLLDATFGQIHLTELLGHRVPAYAHVPLVVSEHGGRLAKRDGSVTLADRLALGDTPTDVVAFLLRSAGLDVPSDADELSAPELLAAAAAEFDPVRIDRRPLVMSAARLAGSLRSPG